MAIKASATITLSFMVDVKAIYRYYKLQASTASAPSKPTTNPPSSDWATSEPSYTSGSTNTLYFVDLTVFTNDTFSYSDVSKSSSYEAAKEAYNKATNAAKTATDYIYYDSADGLQIGDKSSGSWTGTRAQINSSAYNLLDQEGAALASFGVTATIGKMTGNNVHIDSDSVDIRDQTTTLASFGANKIGDHNYTQMSCDGNLDIMSSFSPSTESNKRGGLIVTDGINSSTWWSDVSGMTWSELSSSTWADLGGEGWLKSRGTYFETSMYASETNTETSNGSNSTSISMLTRSEVQYDGSSRLVSKMTLTSDSIHISANKSFTYDIPIIVTADCNTITESGKYYLGTNSTNRPVALNGWLEVMKYSTGYCFQRFTTYKGSTYERNMIANAWGAWGRQMRQYVLFDNDSNGFSSSVTLSESAANFDKFTIVYRSNDNFYASSEVLSPNGKSVSLTISVLASDSNLYLKSKVVFISGTSITTASSGSVYCTGNAAVNGSYNPNKVNCVAITQVIGWR